jgi:hypothetical protein
MGLGRRPVEADTMNRPRYIRRPVILIAPPGPPQSGSDGVLLAGCHGAGFIRPGSRSRRWEPVLGRVSTFPPAWSGFRTPIERRFRRASHSRSGRERPVNSPVNQIVLLTRESEFWSVHPGCERDLEGSVRTPNDLPRTGSASDFVEIQLAPRARPFEHLSLPRPPSWPPCLLRSIDRQALMSNGWTRGVERQILSYSPSQPE